MTPKIETAPLPQTDVEGIPDLVAGLRSAFESGTTRPLDWRREQLQALGKLVEDNGEELVAAMQADLRKPTLEAWAADLVATVGEVKLALKSLRRWTRPVKVATPLSQQPARARIVREPLGVVLIISPWNYPVQLLLSPLVGAIAAGNCAMLKPSEITAHTSAALAKLVPKYLDNDCIALVEGGVDETSALLAERFDHIFYTGNGRVARVVMEAAAKHLTPVTLELGGKSPCIVDAGVDLEQTARRILWGKFLNAGQTCVAPDYVLAHSAVEPELLEAMKRVLSEFYGDDPRANPDFGRIPNQRHQRRVASLVKDGEVVVGGESDEGDCYVSPTILRNVSPEAPSMQEEIFGPVLPVLTVDSVDEAISFVNGRDKPLALYVFTKDRTTEEAVVSRTSSGGVCVNAVFWHIANPELPFGGVGPSGTGAYHGRSSFETFSHRKSVVTKGTRFDPKMAYPPYGKLMTKLIKRLV